MTTSAPRTGGQILVDALIAQGVDRLTCVPGESYLAVLDALHDTAVDVVVCRNEGGAAMMAEAYGKLTGRPGICFVTRGPGSTNAMHGVHIARQDSTPMILFVGQIERGMREREAFQELDYRAVFGSIAKWATEIDDPARIPELIARAFRVACQGRPGPVVIALPEDMLVETAVVADPPAVEPAETWPGLTDMVKMQKLLWAAERPLVILGGSRWTERAQREVVRFAERFDLPVATSFRRSALFPQDHPNYAGDVGIGPNPKLAARVKEADVLVLVGARMSEMPSSSYSLIDVPQPRQTLVHVHPDPEEIGRVYQPAVGIVATPRAFAAALETVQPPVEIRWRETARAARADYDAWTGTPKPLPGAFQYGEAVKWLKDRLPPETIVCNGAGNYAIWVHRYWRHNRLGTQLAPTSGSMGYGVPAAVMAKHLHRDRPVVAFAGDGCFMMNGQEFATAVQYDLPILVIVVDNGMYGTIRMHQEREYPGRPSGTKLANPDFAAYARAFGGHGETVRTTEEFAPAAERALASGRPAILHCLIDPQAITPAKTLDEISAGR
ncbi:thiamine pyrophosphate-binding protein [Oharaeibacter diazotrophicus]|uniref:Acetolactate synthase-1/2/3 large subunit n=1 Tax=Oharaeibacter diazotrophicus TaxID=1920512 RepID=A0A4R6RK36_9HYPH|nr:thiamine pyrophosphate-binding protein [Oharaeibacter diazotrophicus]TDP86939.1 acetolactate synthase-1/2/3 large subunit [Oharaeibacter diazotrophicus]BBE71118.1 acetolactate synthase isozyme 2 large subunit [Pleomorphomonas sp. SM30]GLS77872.1 thiamine pyrophosphate protein [Oharaeibacter diazotrophicus]